MTQEFLNEEKLPFKDCARQEQHILLDAWIDGKLQAYDHDEKWCQVSELTFCNIWILRTKPIKRLAIPWEHINEGFRFACMAPDGRVNLHSEKPYICEPTGVWTYRGGYVSLSMMNIDVTGIDWRDSLVERPADK